MFGGEGNFQSALDELSTLMSRSSLIEQRRRLADATSIMDRATSIEQISRMRSMGASPGLRNTSDLLSNSSPGSFSLRLPFSGEAAAAFSPGSEPRANVDDFSKLLGTDSTSKNYYSIDLLAAPIEELLTKLDCAEMLVRRSDGSLNGLSSLRSLSNKYK